MAGRRGKQRSPSSIVGQREVAQITRSPEENLLFSLKDLPDKGKYSGSSLNADELQSFIKKLRILSAMSWSAVDKAPRQKHGYEVIPEGQINPDARRYIPAGRKIWSFRISQKSRMGGYREGQVLFILLLGQFYDH